MDSDTYLGAVSEIFDATPDAIHRAHLINNEIGAMNEVLARLGHLRAVAVRDARQGMSVQRIADALGVTRARVYQIVNE